MTEYRYYLKQVHDKEEHLKEWKYYEEMYVLAPPLPTSQPCRPSHKLGKEDSLSMKDSIFLGSNLIKIWII